MHLDLRMCGRLFDNSGSSNFKPLLCDTEMSMSWILQNLCWPIFSAAGVRNLSSVAFMGYFSKGSLSTLLYSHITIFKVKFYVATIFQ